jgi:predicted nucleic acid-binding protein
MTAIVSDTSPIRSLAYLDQLHLLQLIYGEVTIPPAVARELETGRSRPQVMVADIDYVVNESLSRHRVWRN